MVPFPARTIRQLPPIRGSVMKKILAAKSELSGMRLVWVDSSSRYRTRLRVGDDGRKVAATLSFNKKLLPRALMNSYVQWLNEA